MATITTVKGAKFDTDKPAAYAAYAAAKKANQQLTADLVRQTIPIEKYAI